MQDEKTEVSEVSVKGDDNVVGIGPRLPTAPLIQPGDEVPPELQSLGFPFAATTEDAADAAAAELAADVSRTVSRMRAPRRGSPREALMQLNEDYANLRQSYSLLVAKAETAKAQLMAAVTLSGVGGFAIGWLVSSLLSG